MAVLDDDDPVSILSTNIIRVLNKQDGALALAALASVLASMIDYAQTKTRQPIPESWNFLRDDLTDLVAGYIRTREEEKHARS